MGTKLTEDQLATSKEITYAMHVSQGTVRNLAIRGLLTPIRIGRAVRFEPAQVNQILAKGALIKPRMMAAAAPAVKPPAMPSMRFFGD